MMGEASDITPQQNDRGILRYVLIKYMLLNDTHCGNKPLNDSLKSFLFSENVAMLQQTTTEN